MRESVRDLGSQTVELPRIVIPYNQKYNMIVALNKSLDSLITYLQMPAWKQGNPEVVEIPTGLLMDLFALGVQQESKRNLTAILRKRIEEWQTNFVFESHRYVGAVKYKIPVDGEQIEEFYVPSLKIAFNNRAAFCSKGPRKNCGNVELVRIPIWVVDVATQVVRQTELGEEFKEILLQDQNLMQFYDL
jgi:hypothetical protein